MKRIPILQCLEITFMALANSGFPSSMRWNWIKASLSFHSTLNKNLNKYIFSNFSFLTSYCILIKFYTMSSTYWISLFFCTWFLFDWILFRSQPDRLRQLVKRILQFITIREFPPANGQKLPSISKSRWWIPCATRILALISKYLSILKNIWIKFPIYSIYFNLFQFFHLVQHLWVLTWTQYYIQDCLKHFCYDRIFNFDDYWNFKIRNFPLQMDWQSTSDDD